MGISRRSTWICWYQQAHPNFCLGRTGCQHLNVAYKIIVNYGTTQAKNYLQHVHQYLY